MPLTEVMTLSGLNGSDPAWRTRMINPPVVTPQWPQNLLQQTALGSIVKVVGIGGTLGDANGGTAPAVVATPSNPYGPLWAVTATAGAAASVYHGYKRNNSIGWALWWGLMGSMFPVVTVPVAIAQGFGKKG